MPITIVFTAPALLHSCGGENTPPDGAAEDGHMDPAIDAALSRGGGALTWAALQLVADKANLDFEVRRVELVRLAPRVYARPWSLDDVNVAELAAVRYASPNALLSHTSALRRFGLLRGAVGAATHVCVSASRRLRGVKAALCTRPIIVHRTAVALRRDSSTKVPCVPPQTALAQAWSTLSGTDQRAPLIRAVRTGVCPASAVRLEAANWSNLRGGASLLATLELLEAGCESELEIWGHQMVFAVGELDRGIWQYPIHTSRGRYRIDLAYLDAKLAVELDGRAYHESPAQWAHDIARDLELAKLGWQTIRLSHRRLTNDVEGCRRDVLQVLAERSNGPSAD